MLNFKKIKKEKKETHVFLSNVNTRYLDWAFADEGITDYSIVPLTKIDLPDDVRVPDFIPITPGSKTKRNCKRPVVLISHMNAVELYEKIVELYKLEDIDLIAHIKKEQQIAKTNYEQNYKKYIPSQPVISEVL